MLNQSGALDQVFQALADPTRRWMVERLSRGPASVSELAEPFTMSLPLTPLDGGRLLPYDCHEGNYALLQSLGGERAEDRALEADLKKGIIRERRPVQGGLGVGGQPVGEGGPGLPPR